MTNQPPAELNALIEAHIHAFNTQDLAGFLSVFGPDAIVVDGIAPYCWLNPDAPAHWLEDVDRWRIANGVKGERLTYEMGFWNVEGRYAYAVISGTLSVDLKEATVVRTGTLAYTFAMNDDVWKIQAQAWGRTS